MRLAVTSSLPGSRALFREFTAFPEDGRPVAAAAPGSYSTAR